MNFDLNKKKLREVNNYLQNIDRKDNKRKFELSNPQGQHAICAGLKDEKGVTTGISAKDRAHTIKTAIKKNVRSKDI